MGPLALLVALCLHATGCGEESESVEETENARASWASNCETIVVVGGMTVEGTVQPLVVQIVAPPNSDDERTGVYFMGNERIDTPEALERRLRVFREKLADPNEVAIVLQPVSGVWWRWVTRAMDSSVRAGFRHVGVGGYHHAVAVKTLARTSDLASELPGPGVKVSEVGHGNRPSSDHCPEKWVVNGERFETPVDSAQFPKHVENQVIAARDGNRENVRLYLACHPRTPWDQIPPYLFGHNPTVSRPLFFPSCIPHPLPRGFPPELTGPIRPVAPDYDGSFSFHGTDVSKEAKYIVFVTDRSGAMVAVFDYVCLEMQLAISQMGPKQWFDIILFGNDRPIEGPRYNLVPGTAESKIAVVEFLQRDGIRPCGRTSGLPALKRAFEVLTSVGGKKDKVILLVTDGGFSGVQGNDEYRGKSGDDAVLNFLKDANAKGDVTIHTFLFGDDKRATETMKTIASQNGGTFRTVDLDDWDRLMEQLFDE